MGPLRHASDPREGAARIAAPAQKNFEGGDNQWHPNKAHG
jgi:hypothetical protein